MRNFIFAVFLTSALFLEGALSFGAPVPAFDKVMVVVLENTDLSRALKQDFLKSLAARGALLTNYHGVTHPSQPNYISMIAGSTMGVTNDQNVNLEGQHLGDLLETAGKSWKVYADQYPGTSSKCFLGAIHLLYARKHVPFLSFKNIQNSPDRCAKIVKDCDLDADIKAGALPNFSMYIPNLRHDGHNLGVKVADHWMKKTFSPLLDNPAFMKGMLLIVTFDESSNSEVTNNIYTVLVGDAVKPGAVDHTEYSHFNLLKTIETGFGLKDLGREDVAAQPISGVWK